jgi:hypothetical protein
MARGYSPPVARGALAGAAAALVWAASEPVLGRLLGVRYSDLRLLGATVTRGPLWPVAGLTLHAANGAVFGSLFERVGLRGPAAGLAAAQLENLALWPGMAAVDRLHPDRRSGAWPPLLGSGSVFAYEVATHAIFGLVLGALLRDDRG